MKQIFIYCSCQILCIAEVKRSKNYVHAKILYPFKDLEADYFDEDMDFTSDRNIAEIIMFLSSVMITISGIYREMNRIYLQEIKLRELYDERILELKDEIIGKATECLVKKYICQGLQTFLTNKIDYFLEKYGYEVFEFDFNYGLKNYIDNILNISSQYKGFTFYVFQNSDTGYSLLQCRKLQLHEETVPLEKLLSVLIAVVSSVDDSVGENFYHNYLHERFFRLSPSQQFLVSLEANKNPSFTLYNEILPSWRNSSR